MRVMQREYWRMRRRFDVIPVGAVPFFGMAEYWRDHRDRVQMRELSLCGVVAWKRLRLPDDPLFAWAGLVGRF
jgi:hypothetical protein